MEQSDSNGEVTEMRMDEDWARSARGGMTFADTGGRASETERHQGGGKSGFFRNGGGEQKMQTKRFLLDANKF